MSLMSYPQLYFWLLPFLAALAGTVLLERVCARWEIYDYPGERKMQKNPVPRMGGSAFFAVLMIFGASFSISIPRELLWAGGLVFLGGLYDDLRPANTVVKKLAFQIPAALLFASVIDLTYLQQSAGALLLIRGLIFCFIFFFTNAANLMDNMNGLTAGLSVVLLAGLSFVAAVKIQNGNLAAVGLLLAVSLLGFYVRNFPHGHIYMGDQGSQFLGLFTAGYAVLVVPRALVQDVANPLLLSVSALFILFFLYIFDVVSVTVIRLREGRSPFIGDQRHVSHRLVGRGVSPTIAVLSLTAIQAVLTGAVLFFFKLGSLGRFL